MSVITISQAAQAAGRSDKTLRRAIDAGELRAQPRDRQNQPIMIDLADLQAYLDDTRGVQVQVTEISIPLAGQPEHTDLLTRIAALEEKLGGRKDLTLTAVAEKHNELALLVKKFHNELAAQLLKEQHDGVTVATQQENETLRQKVDTLERRIQEMEEERDRERSLSGGGEYLALTLATITQRIEKLETWAIGQFAQLTDGLNDTSGIDATDKQLVLLEQKLATLNSWVEPFLKQHHDQIDGLEKFEVWATGLLKQVSDHLAAEEKLTTWLKERVMRLAQEKASLAKRLDTLGREKSTFAISEELKEVAKRVAALEQEKTGGQAPTDLTQRIDQLETDEAHDVADITRSLEKVDATLSSRIDKQLEVINELRKVLAALVEDIKDINAHISDLRASTTKSTRKRTTKDKDAEQTIEDESVMLYPFAAAHGVRQAMIEGVIQQKMLQPLFYKSELYLDLAGQKRFWQIFNNGPNWADCPHCPHGAEANGKP